MTALGERCGGKGLEMRRVPPWIVAVFDGLKLSGSRPEGLRGFNDPEWEKMLEFLDLMHLTLRFGHVCREYLPDWVRLRIENNLADNIARFERIKVQYAELAAALAVANAEHLVLKGFAQSATYGQNPHLRVQSDIDLFCPSEALERVQHALIHLGYEPDKWTEHFPSDQHLTTMIRRTNWSWSGNRYDPQMPLSIEVHFLFWNTVTTCIDPGNLDQFWERRIVARVGGMAFPALNPVDGMAYGCLHALRHILYGSLLANHVYELASFLHSKKDDSEFWDKWAVWHSAPLKSLEAICFYFAREWFGSYLSDKAREEVERLPSSTKHWLEKYKESPLGTWFRPNKDGLWLHLSLVASGEQRRRVLAKRLLVGRMPSVRGLIDGHAKLYASRIYFHGRTLLPTLWKGIDWHSRR